MLALYSSVYTPVRVYGFVKTSLAQKVAAEMVGTFALVFAGCGAIVVDALTGGGISHVGIALTFGLVIMVMIYATGHICGAHFNPAVTIAFWAFGRFPGRWVGPYVAGQLVAALAAALALRAILGDVAQLGATSPQTGLWPSFALEVVLAFFLMFVITAVATDGRAVRQQAGWAIGGTVALGALFGGPISGASMNPARSIGPALVSGSVEQLWVYVAAPVVGALLGAGTYAFIARGQTLDDAAGSD